MLDARKDPGKQGLSQPRFADETLRGGERLANRVCRHEGRKTAGRWETRSGYACRQAAQGTRRENGPSGPTPGVRTPAPSLTRRATFGKSLQHPVPQSPHPNDENSRSTSLAGGSEWHVLSPHPPSVIYVPPAAETQSSGATSATELEPVPGDLSAH